MTNYLLFFIVLLLFYIIHLVKKPEEKAVEMKTLSYDKILPDYLNKNCEITFKESMAELDMIYSVSGIIVDMDEEWFLIEVMSKKKKVQRLIRIANIESLKEIYRS